jgi:hypothetical protein
MGILSISNVIRVSTSTEDSSAPATTMRQAMAPLPEKIDPVTQQPLPPRFPWLSRLSQQLETAARQRPAFAPAPVLGDHVDKSA